MNPYLALSTIACLLFYFATGANVGRYRIRHKFYAPAITGHPEVERAIRVQANTLEWLVIFLPSLWMFCAFFDARIGAGAALVWIVGRVLYMTGYLKDPASRGPGFLTQAAATAVVLFGSLAGLVMQIVHDGWG